MWMGFTNEISVDVEVDEEVGDVGDEDKKPWRLSVIYQLLSRRRVAKGSE